MLVLKLIIDWSNMQEKRGDTKNSVISSEMQEVVPCSMKELVSSDVKEEVYNPWKKANRWYFGVCNPNLNIINMYTFCSSIQDHSSSAENLYAELGMTCSSNAAGITSFNSLYF